MKAMRFSSLASPIVVSLALAVSGCDEGNNTPDVVFGSPIDFSVACEGAGATFKPVMTDDADDQGLCDDPADDSVRAHLLGLVLNRSPAEVHILQLNDDRRVGNESLGTGIVDADRFKPGFNGIPVASALEAPPFASVGFILRGERW